jgi:hypothetical protein
VIIYTVPLIPPSTPSAGGSAVNLPLDTVLGSHPPKKVKTAKAKAKVKFTFSANAGGATFLCKLDKGSYAPCVSPKRLKVKIGKHKFSVKAVRAGVADPTPASFKFTVVKAP